MKLVRRIHGWLGVLFAPSLILFALSGVLQMYGCHEGEGEDAAPGWLATVARIHIKQTTEAPRRRPRPAGATATAPGSPGASGPAEAARSSRDAGPAATPAPPGSPAPASPTRWPLQLFFALMSVGLVASSVLGAWVALASKRDRNLHLGLLVAGVMLPVLLLLLQ
ncbi:MAG: hypothetical protein KA297_00220 [Kofleriaceae bacterium]|jgi:hypothetical protein|nr:hypothetical protein [Kofleriaceae bacterium]